jgi:hypothetical protein
VLGFRLGTVVPLLPLCAFKAGYRQNFAFFLKKDEGSEQYMILCNEKLHNSYWAEHAAKIGKTKNAKRNFDGETSCKSDHLETK